jgi:hypothetical protein
MNATPEEARASIDEVEKIVARTRGAIASARCGPMLVLWGVIWMIGYAGTQFFPAWSGRLWAGLDLAGGAGSFFMASGSRSLRGHGLGRRIGLAWLALGVYAVLWAYILAPFNGRFFGAYPAAVAMFGHVVIGIFLDVFMLFLGLAVTAITVAGMFLLPDWFNLWMAATAGGSLVAAGFHIQTRWK